MEVTRLGNRALRRGTRLQPAFRSLRNEEGAKGDRSHMQCISNVKLCNWNRTCRIMCISASSIAQLLIVRSHGWRWRWAFFHL
eukprot:135633-Amphidinium_carterae.5